MNPDDFRDPLEERLAALHPADLPANLAERLADAEPARRNWTPWLWAAPLAAAAALMLLAQPVTETPHAPAAEAMAKVDLRKGDGSGVEVLPSDFRVFVPVSERSHLVEVSDLGIVESSQPVRLLRTRWVDDTTFRGDDGQSTLRRARPRERIVPVALEVY